MNTQKNRSPRLILSIGSLVVSVAGLLMVGLLNVLTDGVNQFNFGMYLNETIQLLTNPSTADPNLVTSYIMKAGVTFMVIIGFVWSLVLIIISIINIVKPNKEGSAIGAAVNTAKLSFVPLIIFGFITFFTYFNDGTDSLIPALGLYLALGLGALGTCLAAVNYFLSSEKPLVNRILRSCLLAVGYAAAVFALMPTIVVGGATFAPGTLFLIRLSSMMGGGAIGSTFYMYATIFVLLILVSSSTNTAASSAIDERVNKFGKTLSNSVKLIVVAALAVVLVVGALIVVPLIDPTKSITVNMYAYIAIALACLTLILVIVTYILSKKEKPQEKPQVEPVVNVVLGEEPAEEPAPVEEAQPEEEAVAAPVVASEEVEEPVEEAQEEPEVQEEAAPQEEESEPAPVEEAPAEEEKPAEKAEPKKKAPTKKPVEKKEAAPAKKPAPKKEEPKAEPKKKTSPAKKEEPKAEPKAEPASKKNTASYHLSKRASDNKWQVFRAGSDKVIKLFDTKVEAEEYTKRMAENQGVSYLSHASKGKNKGRIQKK